MRQPYTVEQLAARLANLASEHGTPNSFHVHELIDGNRFRLAAVGLLRGGAFASAMAARGFTVQYLPADGGKPAAIAVDVLA